MDRAAAYPTILLGGRSFHNFFLPVPSNVMAKAFIVVFHTRVKERQLRHKRLYLTCTSEWAARGGRNP